MEILQAKNDLTSFSQHDIALLADYYNISTNDQNDLRWMIAIHILEDYNATLQSAHMPLGTAWNRYKDRLLERFDMDSTAPEHAKHANELPKEIWAADPTRNNRYLEWIITSYLDGGVQRFEDFGRLKTSMEKYKHLLDHKLIKKEDRWYMNINALCGLSGCLGGKREKIGLDTFLANYADELKLIHTVEEKHIAKKYVDKIYEDSDLLIVSPLTEAAACKYGAGTKWCTAGREDNLFTDYLQKGALYILIPKHPKHSGEKYQLNIDEFRNEINEDTSITPITKKFPILIKIPELKKALFYAAIRDSNVNLVDHFLHDLQFEFDPLHALDSAIWLSKEPKIVELIAKHEQINLVLNKNIKLIIAGALGDKDMVKKLLEDPSVNLGFQFGEREYAAINASVNMNNKEITQLLLNKLGSQTLSGINFLGQDLSGMNLSGLDLTEATFVQSNLDMANLSRANLAKATIELANLHRANLEGANLQGASIRSNLQGANLKNTNLQNAILFGADLRGANLEGANLKDALFNGAKIDEYTRGVENYTSQESGVTGIRILD